MSAAEESPLDWAGLGRAIRLDRAARGMNQQALAAAAGLDRKTISNYENGRIPAPGRIPDGYHAVSRVLSWPPGRVDELLGLPSPLTG
ncbi:helix-turn-helix domain-containing protein, partial [Kitasatospora nipponensis]